MRNLRGGFTSLCLMRGERRRKSLGAKVGDSDPEVGKNQWPMANVLKEPVPQLNHRASSCQFKPLPQLNLRMNVANMFSKCYRSNVEENVKNADTEWVSKNVTEDKLANEPAAVKSCLMVTAIGELLIKKNPAIEVTADKPMFHVPDEEMQENLSS